jgi:hypothetical protein
VSAWAAVLLNAVRALCASVCSGDVFSADSTLVDRGRAGTATAPPGESAVDVGVRGCDSTEAVVRG